MDAVAQSAQRTGALMMARCGGGVTWLLRWLTVADWGCGVVCDGGGEYKVKNAHARATQESQTRTRVRRVRSHDVFSSSAIRSNVRM